MLVLPFIYRRNKMANLALHNTTLAELQEFLYQNSLSLSEKFTVIFDKDVKQFSINEQPKAENSEQSFIDFTQLAAVGMWADREDMADSVEYVRKLRQEQWG